MCRIRVLQTPLIRSNSRVTQAAQMLHTSKFAVPFSSPLERRAGIRHTLSPQSSAALAPPVCQPPSSASPTLPQQLQAGARTAVVPAILLPLGAQFPSPVSGGMKQRASNTGEKKKTSFPGSGAFPPLGSAAPWSVLIKQTVLKDTLK